MMIDEPLYPYAEPFDWEKALFSSSTVRRLKHLAHFGAGVFISPVVHSRFEHTVGVWKLVQHFFPDDRELRAAAILHDIGHLPFSHAVEKTLGFNHHQLTETYIGEQEINEILQKANLSSDRIIARLNEETPLTGSGQVLGLDHLDSFLRDTYMAGLLDMLPRDILPKLRCTNDGIETDTETGLYLLRLIERDHRLFLEPKMIAVDRILAEAVRLHSENEKAELLRFARLTDADVIALLKNSPSEHVRLMIDVLLFCPEKIKISKKLTGKGLSVKARKIYQRVPLCDGRLLTTIDQRAAQIYHQLGELIVSREVVLE